MTMRRIEIFLILSLVTTLSMAQMSPEVCLPEKAYYNSQTKQCVCNEGYAGVGDLCCEEPKSTKICHLVGDQLLTSPDGTRVRLSIPCFTLFSHTTRLQDWANDIGVCQFKVFQKGKFVEKNVLYPERIDVQVIEQGGKSFVYTILDHSKMILPDGKELRPTRASGDVFTYRDVIQNKKKPDTIDVSYDFVRRLWTIKGCNNTVTFRPLTGNASIQQDSKPGLCVTSKGNIEGFGGGLSLCNMVKQPKRKGNWDTARQNPREILSEVLLRQWQDEQNIRSRLASDVSGQDFKDYTDTCFRIRDKIFHEKKFNWQEKDFEETYAACGAILDNQGFLSCFDYIGITGHHVIDLLVKCVQFHLSGDQKRCQRYLDVESPDVKACFPTMCHGIVKRKYREDKIEEKPAP